MSIPDVPEPIDWENFPSTDTPFEAGQLNLRQQWHHDVATLARGYALTAQQGAADATAPTDTMIANALETIGSNARTAADDLYAAPNGVDSARYVTPDTGVDTTTEFTAALAAAEAAATYGAATLLVRPGEYVFDQHVTVPAGVTVQGMNGAVLITTGDDHVFEAESGTTFRGLTFKGTNPVGGAATLTGQYGINAVGAGGARLSDIHITGCRFEGIEYAAVRIRHTDRFQVTGCTFLDTGYSAVQIGCAADGQVTGNVFRGTGVLPTYAVNSYAVSMSLDSGAIDPVNNPQPTRITISGNIVTNQAWEALDTHGGTELEFSGNIIVGCEMGIAVTWRTGTAGSGPQKVVVTGNVINGAGYPDLAVRAGMSINGAGDGSSYATAVITGNYVANHGVSKDHPAQWDPRSGGIVASWCDTLIVADNILDTIRGAGISFKTCTTVVATGNAFRAMWRETGDTARLSSCVYLDNAASVTLSGNTYRFATESKDNPNERAIYAVSGSTNQVVDLGNNWGSRLNENVSRLAQGRGSFNDGIDLGGSSRANGATPAAPPGSTPLGSTPPSSYPPGVTHWNATASATHGWPFNGLLINYNYSARQIQVIHESNTTSSRMATRASTDGSTWGAWKTFTGA